MLLGELVHLFQKHVFDRKSDYQLYSLQSLFELRVCIKEKVAEVDALEDAGVDENRGEVFVDQLVVPEEDHLVHQVLFERLEESCRLLLRVRRFESIADCLGPLEFFDHSAAHRDSFLDHQLARLEGEESLNAESRQAFESLVFRVFLFRPLLLYSAAASLPAP